MPQTARLTCASLALVTGAAYAQNTSPISMSTSGQDAAEPSIDIPAIGLQLRIRLPGGASDGTLEVIETVNAPGFGPPLHRHPQTEVFRVLAGSYLFEVDGKRFVAEAGDLVSVPGGTPHAFRNITGAPARQLVMILPGFDAAAFFTGLGELMRDGIPQPSVLNAFGQRWEVEFLGPPLSNASDLIEGRPGH